MEQSTKSAAETLKQSENIGLSHMFCLSKDKIEFYSGSLSLLRQQFLEKDFDTQNFPVQTRYLEIYPSY